MTFSVLKTLASRTCYHLWTLFLFTESNIKAAFLPIMLIAVASAPLASLNRLPHTAFWLWFHILQFDMSNQTLMPEEDQFNKSDRPLPAKRISLRNALILRWAFVPLCFLLSACYSLEVVRASVALCLTTFIYNEVGLAAHHWLIRNIMNALVFVSGEVGTCLIAGKNQHALDDIGAYSVLCSGAILITTIQAQDFRDTVGDKLVGRKTLPLVAPTVARPTLVFALFAWTTVLSSIWKLSVFAVLAFYCLTLFVGARFVLWTSIEADRRNFHLYSIWLSAVHVLPAYFRFIASHVQTSPFGVQ